MFLGSKTDGRPLYGTPTEFALVKKCSLKNFGQDPQGEPKNSYT